MVSSGEDGWNRPAASRLWQRCEPVRPDKLRPAIDTQNYPLSERQRSSSKWAVLRMYVTVRLPILGSVESTAQRGARRQEPMEAHDGFVWCDGFRSAGTKSNGGEDQSRWVEVRTHRAASPGPYEICGATAHDGALERGARQSPHSPFHILSPHPHPATPLKRAGSYRFDAAG